MKNLFKKIALTLTLIMGATSIPTFAGTTTETIKEKIVSSYNNSEKVTLNNTNKEIINNIE